MVYLKPLQPVVGSAAFIRLKYMYISNLQYKILTTTTEILIAQLHQGKRETQSES